MKQKTQGEKIRTTAAILCKNVKFQEYIFELNKNKTVTYEKSEEAAKLYICANCKIYSRSELSTNEHAQKVFKQINRNYLEWTNPIEEKYADNLNRQY